MIDKVISLYAITDDILKAIGHPADCRRSLDAEVLTTAFVAATFFSGNQTHPRHGLSG